MIIPHIFESLEQSILMDTTSCNTLPIHWTIRTLFERCIILLHLELPIYHFDTFRKWLLLFSNCSKQSKPIVVQIQKPFEKAKLHALSNCWEPIHLGNPIAGCWEFSKILDWRYCYKFGRCLGFQGRASMDKNLLDRQRGMKCFCDLRIDQHSWSLQSIIFFPLCISGNKFGGLPVCTFLTIWPDKPH